MQQEGARTIWVNFGLPVTLNFSGHKGTDFFTDGGRAQGGFASLYAPFQPVLTLGKDNCHGEIKLM